MNEQFCNFCKYDTKQFYIECLLQTVLLDADGLSRSFFKFVLLLNG